MAVTTDWKAACRHLNRVDSRLAEIIDKIGPCTLTPRRDYFVVLCKAIYSQQLSTRVAAVLFGRFKAQFPRKRPTPDRVAALLLDSASLGRCGLSRQKGLGLREAVQKFYGMKERPTAAEVTERGVRWRPYRTIATWYLWRGLGQTGTPKAGAAKSPSKSASRRR